MKTKIKTIVAIVAIGMIGFTNVSAIADNRKAVNSEFTAESDEILSIESWMINEAYWSSETKIEVLENEAALEIESWMTTESYWTSETAVDTLEAEKPLEVELWMTDERLWK